MSFDHIWVDYPGKRANAIENDAVVLVDDRGWHWPSQLDFGDEIRNQIAFYWTPMPQLRKVMFVGGLVVLGAWGTVRRRLAPMLHPRAATAASGQDAGPVSGPGPSAAESPVSTESSTPPVQPRLGDEPLRG